MSSSVQRKRQPRDGEPVSQSHPATNHHNANPMCDIPGRWEEVHLIQHHACVVAERLANSRHPIFPQGVAQEDRYVAGSSLGCRYCPTAPQRWGTTAHILCVGETGQGRAGMEGEAEQGQSGAWLTAVAQSPLFSAPPHPHLQLFTSLSSGDSHWRLRAAGFQQAHSYPPSPAPSKDWQ